MKQQKDNVLAENYHRIATYRLGSAPGEKVYALKKAYHRRNILARIRKHFLFATVRRRLFSPDLVAVLTKR